MNSAGYISSTFSEQLCGCLTDMFSCLITFNVPFGICVVHSLATNQITNSGFMRACVISTLTCCFGMSYNRQNMKRSLVIPQSYWADCITYLCCASCATAQDYREAENRYLANP